jgi:STE24 endopeptidase
VLVAAKLAAKREEAYLGFYKTRSTAEEGNIMKRVILSAILLLGFLVFSIATTKIGKGGIDLKNVSPEITSVLSPDKVEQAILLSDFKAGWYFFTTAFDVLVLAGILWFGFSGRIKNLSEKLADWLHRQRSPLAFAASLGLVLALALSFATATDKHPVEAGSLVFAVLWGVVALFAGRHRNYAVKVFYILILSLAIWLIGLPLSYYRGFVIEHHFNLSTQTFGNWLADTIKSGYIGALFMTVLIPFAYWGISKRAKDWWLWIGIVAVPIMIFVIVVVPVFVSPMFNKFEPLKDEALAQRILGMAEKAGISGGRIYQVDMSEQTQAINAYVTGLFGSKRIVLWDTTIKKMTPDEIAFVMAHEMGHYVMNHVWIGIGLFSVIFLILLFIIHKSIGWFIHRYSDSFGFAAVSDIASLPLLMLMFSLMMFLLDPLTNGFSRKIEHDSDRFALDLTRDNASGVSAFIKLANENLSNPSPSAFIEFWQYSHPPLQKRIEFCRSYTPKSN